MNDDSVNKYHFGHNSIGDAFDGVEIPKLESLIGELEAVLKKYGVALYARDSADTSPLLLIRNEDDDDYLRGMIVDGLENYEDGVDWLDVARNEWVRHIHEYEADRLKHKKEVEHAHDINREQELLQHGLVLNGRHYSLVQTPGYYNPAPLRQPMQAQTDWLKSRGK